MPREFPLTDLDVEMRRSADGGFYQFGVVVDGVFVSFAARKAGGVDDDLARADEAKAQEAANQPAAPTPTPTTETPAPTTEPTPAPAAPAETQPADTQPPTAG